MVKYKYHAVLDKSTPYEDFVSQNKQYPSITIYYRSDGIEGARLDKYGWIDMFITAPLSVDSVKAAIEAYIGVSIELV